MEENIKLTPMTEEEYNFWALRSRKAFAKDKMKANGYTKEEADKIAAESFRKLLPNGLRSENNFLYSVKNVNQQTLGFIWFGIQSFGEDRRAFIYDILIEEPFRGRGLGKQTMLLIEGEIKRQGLNRVGLHVFGFNKAAINLYQSIGYLTTDLVMEKSI